MEEDFLFEEFFDLEGPSVALHIYGKTGKLEEVIVGTENIEEFVASKKWNKVKKLKL
jgi:hypothetical protein